MKRVICLIVATLLATVMIVPPAAAQGQNGQQVQDRVRQAQQYMQSPEGQQALQQAWDHLQQAKDEVQQALQQFQKSREGAQEEMKEGISTKIERTIQKIPKSGGVAVGSLLLPAAALLLGS